MNIYLYSVYDKKASTYKTPFVFNNTDEAVRAFGSVCSDTNSELCKYAEDYQLEIVGEFNTVTGEIFPESDTDDPIRYPKVITTALEAKKQFLAQYGQSETEVNDNA
jgi:hypothetical protein